MKTRELKFKAWDKEAKEMVYHLTDDIMFCFNENTELEVRYWSCDPIDKNYGYWELLDCDILQYTGLKDSEGKEIYEGDIIKHKQGEQQKKLYEYIGIIKFYDGSFFISTNGIRSNLLLSDINGIGEILWHYEGRYGNPSYYYIAKDFEVIGNIYENPELLK